MEKHWSTKTGIKREASFVDLELARRMEMTTAGRAVGYAQAVASFGRGDEKPPVAVLPVGGGYAVFTGPDLPVNRAIGLGMNSPLTRAELETVIEFFRLRGMLPRFDLSPLADPSLLELAAQAGFVVEGYLNLLFCQLTDEVLGLEASPEIRVTAVGSEEEELWLRTVALGFSGEEGEPSAEMIEVIRPNLKGPSAYSYLAWIAGEPAGGGTMIQHARAVELGSASTRIRFRRRGVQTALVYARLTAARSRGCDLAILLTEPGSSSQRNAQHLGFELAYTRMRMVQPRG